MSVHTDIDPCKESSQKCGKVMTHLAEGKTNDTQGHIMRERKKKHKIDIDTSQQSSCIKFLSQWRFLWFVHTTANERERF